MTKHEYFIVKPTDSDNMEDFIVWYEDDNIIVHADCNNDILDIVFQIDNMGITTNSRRNILAICEDCAG